MTKEEILLFFEKVEEGTIFEVREDIITDSLVLKIIIPKELLAERKIVKSEISRWAKIL